MAFRIINDHDAGLIRQIAERAGTLTRSHASPYDPQDAMFDLRLCHLSLPLDLEGLLAAGDADFSHDVLGIRQNLNVWRGPILKNGFTPWFARVRT